MSRPALTLLAVASLATVWLLAGLLPDPAGRTLSARSDDQYADFWSLRWTADAAAAGVNPFVTDRIFHPTGTGLIATEFGLLHGLVATPVLLADRSPRGAVLAHNLLVMLSFVLTGWCAYRFAAAATGARWGAVAAGTVAAFSAFRLHHLEHLNLLAAYWIPLAGWLILRRGESHRAATRLRLDGGLLALAACGLATSLSSPTVGALGLLFLLLWLLVAAAFGRGGDSPGWRRIAEGSFAFTLGLGPVAIAWILTLAPPGASPGELLRWSPDALGFLVPGETSLLARPFAGIDATLHRPAGEEVYLGWAFVAAAILGAITLGRRGLPFSIATVTFLAAALGPGVWWRGEHHSLPLSPYGLLTGVVPFLDALRAPSRFVLPVALVAAPLVAAGFERLRRARAARRLVPLWIAVAVLEIVPAPRPAGRVDVPDRYVRLRDESASGAVVELPVVSPGGMNRYAFHQTIHGRPVVGGPLLRPSAAARDFLRDGNYFRRLVEPATAEAAARELHAHGVRFVVWHRGMMDSISWGNLRAGYGRFATVWSEEPECLVFDLGPVAE